MKKILPSYLSEPQIQYLSQLLDEIHNGQLFVPKFQRGLVWTDEQRLDLLRSLKEGIPIGSLMVWRTTQHHLATFGKIGGQSLPPQPEPTPGAPRAYLLDGHQRLSTLFGALERVSDTAATESSDLDSEEENWNFFYDLEEDDFILQGRRKSKHILLPLKALLDSLVLLKFQRALDKDEALIERTDQLSTVFRNYKVAVVPLVTNDLEHAITAFKRINSSGRKLDEVDMVAALTWGETFDLREELNKIKDRLVVVGWESLEDKFILAACKTRLKVSISNANAAETSKRLKTNPAIINEVAEDLVKVAEFLSNHFGIKSPELLPYSYYQVILLTEVIRQVNFVENQNVIEQLKKWFWYTSYTEAFNGIKELGLQKALEKILSLARAKTSFKIGKNNKINSLPKRFDFRAARAKLVLLRLGELQPHHVIKGETTDSEVAELLAGHGKNAVLRLLSSNSSPENCFLVSPKDHSIFRHHLLEQTEWSQAFLKSQAISSTAAHALKQGGYDKFLEERRKTLIDLEKRFIQPLGLDYEEEE